MNFNVKRRAHINTHCLPRVVPARCRYRLNNSVSSKYFQTCLREFKIFPGESPPSRRGARLKFGRARFGIGNFVSFNPEWMTKTHVRRNFSEHREIIIFVPSVRGRRTFLNPVLQKGGTGRKRDGTLPHNERLFFINFSLQFSSRHLAFFIRRSFVKFPLDGQRFFSMAPYAWMFDARWKFADYHSGA